MKETRINRYQTQCHDNRDSEQMYDYLESRIQVLKKRIFDLEMENASLRCQLEDSDPKYTPQYSAAYN